ncbi:MAG: YebC/PmpR family DNA-binding transcriptional regulator, partial [Candidatus Falkowbacteria bacterium]|nr:YebC/PmpR family DNA-binding transcriptional regulator [Candidatus Falkowbacteria bacterium]
KGVIIIETYKDKIKNIDELELELIEQEIDDLMKDENTLTIYTKIKELQRINKFLESKNIPVSSADIEYIPLEKVELSPDDEKKVESFVNILEDNEDVSDYYSNIS